MEACKLEYNCEIQVHKRSKVNHIFIKAFTYYINTMSTLFFSDVDCHCGYNTVARGIMIHK
ncbi:hypothetical protein SAMN04488508_101635 [Aquimarina spongiae]|uniref:Uncharacterized protein n=1 Tax=Aquimarina spongiae TaxID=570521 RepID=A0A1M6B571_9FLAO|nr:hypothetical protein SAMN04488508_101635 [Aquimarina spongiae]